MDPERGALVYRKTTQIETVEPEQGSEFTLKKIKKVTSETSWLGRKKDSDKEALIKATEDEVEVTPWHDEELESNPLYSSTHYVSDFQNPLYTNRQSTASHPNPVVSEDTIEMSDITPLIPGEGKENSRASRARPGSDNSADSEGYIDYLSAQPDMGNVDTLF